MKSSILSLALILCFTLTPHLAHAFDNNDALAGLDQTRAVFDINQGNPSLLNLRLKLVEKSWQQLHDNGLKPQFVLTFRGRASRFLTKGKGYVSKPEESFKSEIQERLRRLHGLGMPLEQCAIAAELSQIDTEDFIPEVTVVNNGYVSLIGYQNRGYAFIPMD